MYMIANTIRSLQPSSADHTCQATTPRARIGRTVTVPVRKRSRFSLATGWTSSRAQSLCGGHRRRSLARRRKFAPRSCVQGSHARAHRVECRRALRLAAGCRSGGVAIRIPFLCAAPPSSSWASGLGSVDPDRALLDADRPARARGPRSAAGSARGPGGRQPTRGVPRGSSRRRASTLIPRVPHTRTFTRRDLREREAHRARAVRADPAQRRDADPRRLALVAREAARRRGSTTRASTRSQSPARKPAISAW